MGNSVENRTAKRYRFRTRVDLRVRGGGAVIGETVDISLGGLLLVTGDLLPVGSLCEMAITLPAGRGKGFVVAEGTVVRSGNLGTAIRFIRALGEMTLDILAGCPPFRPSLSMPDYVLAYFKVGQGMAEYECQRTFGISRRTFSRISTATLLVCLGCALLLVWLARPWIAPLPGWAKVVGALVYGSAWLLVVHPAVDLAVIRLFWRGRN